MKTMNDFRKLESLNKDRRLKKEIRNITEGKPLGAINIDRYNEDNE